MEYIRIKRYNFLVMKEEIKTFLPRSFLLVLSVLFIATMGYHFIEKIGWVDSLYMAVITITTVGFREVKPLSMEGKIFTIFIILLGVGALFYFAQSLIQYTLEIEISERFTKRRLFGKLKGLNEHYIVCGFGRVGSHCAEELAKARANFVVIENSPEAITLARSFGYLTIEGDATEEEVLRLAGVERAKGLVACLPSDALNLYAILTARSLNPKLYIVARVEHEEAED